MTAKTKPDSGRVALKAVSLRVADIVANGIVHEGKVLKLPKEPEPMSYKDAADALLLKEQEENSTVNAHELIEGNPFDALAAFHAVLKREFGWAVTKDTPSFFGPIPPMMVDVKTGPEPEDVIQAPMGTITLPSLKGLSFTVQFDKQQRGLHLIAECKKYQAPLLTALAALVRCLSQGQQHLPRQSF